MGLWSGSRLPPSATHPFHSKLSTRKIDQTRLRGEAQVVTLVTTGPLLNSRRSAAWFLFSSGYRGAPQVAQWVKNMPAI